MTSALAIWKSNFAIGLPEIDDEHEVLFRCLDAISLARNTSWNLAQSFNALDQLDDYTRSHFRVEECLMRLFDYPELEEHQQQHAYFIAKLGELRTKIVKEDISKDLAILMTHWLLNHIHHIDTKYVTFFKNRGGPRLADET